MIRILILGTGGMAGHMIKSYLQQIRAYELFNTYHLAPVHKDDIQVDIFNADLVKQVISTVKPSIIINCIGTLIGESIASPHKAIYTNAYFPHYLAHIANANDAKVIHLSTDCVFSGKRGKYTEIDVKDAQDTYGLSKSLGELNDALNLTIRTSIIGPEIKEKGEGLFDWLMRQKGIVQGFSKVLWSGVTTLELAKFITYSIPSNLTGLIHLTNGEPINKYDLLSLIQSIYKKKDVQVIKSADKQLDKSLMASGRIDGYSVPRYIEMMMEMKMFMENNKAFYPAYAAYL